MKNPAIIFFILFALTASAKDYNKTEEIINTILNEPSEKKTTAEIKKNPADKKEEQAKDDKEKKKKPVQKKGTQVAGVDESFYKTGIQLFQSGLLPHSMKNFRELTSKFPQSQYADSSKIYIAKILIKEYKYDSAISELGTIAPESGEYPNSIFYTAEANALKGDQITAIENYQKLATMFPEHDLADDSLLRSSKIYLNRNMGEQAIDAAIRIIKYYPTRETFGDAYYQLGKIFEKDKTMKDLESAKKIYKTFLKRARAGEEPFASSPLRKRIERDLKNLEKKHFKLEN